MKYYKHSDEEWVKPLMNGYKMACCDCGLVHTINFRVVNNEVEFQAIRNNKSTAAKRRNKSLTTTTPTSNAK